ncbi:MAG: alpha/beta hydrolase [Myxococcaceae bacterium]|nr:alpha/beta hydrolase [Myxococcaceae bacterium]
MKRAMLGFGIVVLLLLAFAGYRGLRDAQFTKEHAPPGQLLATPSGNVHALVRAGPGRTVLFVHGNPGLALDFAPVMAALPAQLNLIAVDRPGYGWSDRPQADMSPLQQAEMLRAAVAGLKVQKPLLVGFSFGGPVVLAWAQAHAEEVSALVLLGAVADPHAPHTLSTAQSMLAWPLWGTFMSRVIAPFLAPSAIAHGYVDAFFPKPVDAEVIARGQLHFARPSTLQASARDWQVLNADLGQLEKNGRAVQVPVEALYANQDRVVGLSHGKFVETSVPGAHVEYVEQAGHQLMSTHTQVVVATVQRALERSK